MVIFISNIFWGAILAPGFSELCAPRSHYLYLIDDAWGWEKFRSLLALRCSVTVPGFKPAPAGSTFHAHTCLLFNLVYAPWKISERRSTWVCFVCCHCCMMKTKTVCGVCCQQHDSAWLALLNSQGGIYDMKNKHHLWEMIVLQSV